MTKNDSSRLFFLKGFVGFSISSWISSVLSLFSVPIITRVFSTAELGKINIFISIVNLFLNFSYMGIDQAFARFYYEPLGKNDPKSFMGVCLTMAGIIAFIVMLGILVFYKTLSVTIIGYVSFVIPVAVILSIISNMLLRFFNLAARMEKNVVLYNIQAVSITVISNVSYVAVAIYKPSAESAIVFRTALLFSAAIIFLVYKANKVLSFRMDLSKKVVRDVLLYALPICPATILAVSNSSIGQILMKHYVNYSAIGIYSNATTVASIITILQHGINNYWGPYVYENYKTKQPQIEKMHHMIAFAMIMFGLAIIIGQDLIYFLLIGENFWASKQLFPLLIISPVCYTISETLGMGVRLSKKTFLNIPVYAINLIVNVGLCLVLLPKIGVIGAAIATAGSSIAMLVTKSILGERLYRCSDNYFKLIIALLALVTTAVIHIFIYESPIKYIVYLVAMVIVCLAYINEIKSIFLLLNDLKIKFIKKV